MYDYEQLFKTSDILRIRLFHLIFVYTLCNGQYSRSGQIDPLVRLSKAIGHSFEAALANAEQRYWPSAAIEMARMVAEESGPHEYPTEDDSRKYNVLAKQITEKMNLRWKNPDLILRKHVWPQDGLFEQFLEQRECETSFTGHEKVFQSERQLEHSPPKHEAFVYYNCDDCAMMVDKKWINVETDAQQVLGYEYEWWASESKTRLGTARHAGVNIVLLRMDGRQDERVCGEHELLELAWMKEKSEVIPNVVAKSRSSAALLKALDEELSKGNGNPWRAADGGCFRAMLAIRCAHKFIWLELAWKYYQATSDAPYKVDALSGSFNSRCTRVVFIQ